MKKTFLGALILGLVPCLAQAQSSDYPKWYGYGYFAPGGRVTLGSGSRVTIHLGVGVERFLNRHVGMAADLGYLRPVGGGCCNKGWGTLSTNFVARFPPKDSKTGAEGFITGGYTLMVRNDADSGVNFGGGFNWWFEKRTGLRIELRDHLYLGHFHTVGLRIGLTFR